MMRLIAEAWLALQGVWRILTFKPGWQDYFDPSLGGLQRSFAAAGLALPSVAIILAGVWYGSGQLNLFQNLLVYGLSWVVFPLAAALATAISGARGQWAGWVILHNWTTLFTFAIQAGCWMLYIAGLIDLPILGILLGLYNYLRILIHWRLAYVALGLPTITSALLAAIPYLAAQVLVVIISLTLSPPAVPTS